ncbi:hypothetical protein SAMN02745157_0685 [Kaistia soli DSM 19436]|uniref:Helix-turn-helix domain-containing protein n=1 Tax=Kaistia soli DSM 19436 TaxID=1122133 RepID=A0A1M4VEP6_9HYPH|nr:helix-turn-helix domain-containing protein [Kaistia soli]SHE67419.1 hypothetical protein SAMN02745157_0685 [Kaistia soli DSM 19436]
MSGPRYSIIPRAAVVDSRLEGRDLQVLALLGSHTDNDGWCSRSQVKMAREISCGRATVQRSLGRLIECGYVDHRPLLRKDGGDRAHEYRVLLDEVRPGEFINENDELAEVGTRVGEGSEGAVSAAPPCPPVGTPLPTGGQGVPTHERAPIRTTLLERSEREAREREAGGPRVAKLDAGAARAAAADAARADTAFSAWWAAWDGSQDDNLVRSHAAWLRLSDEDRRTAVEFTPVALARRKLTRSNYRAFTYLEERKWLDLRASSTGPVSANEARVPLPPRSQAAFAVFWRRWKAGDPVKVMFSEMLQRPYGVLPSQMPGEAETAALVKIEVARDGRATEEMAAWRDEMAKVGISFTPGDIGMPFVWVPSRWPPGWGAAASVADEYFGDEVRL